MAGHVFISHAHQDRASAEQLLAALESRGIKCWSAPRDVAPGGSYAESILRGIESAGCFVLVFTQHSNLSPHVLREVERALNLGINIIPVRFDDSGVSKSLDYLLATVHWLSATSEPRARALQQAVEKIASCVAGDPSPVVPAYAAGANLPIVLPKPAAAGSGRQLALWICLALLAAAVAALGFLLLRHPTRSTDVAAKNESNLVPITAPSIVPPSSSAVPTSTRDTRTASPESAGTEPPSRSAAPPSAQAKGVIRDPDGYSNVREVASLRSRVIATARDGETVVVLGKERDWIKVSLANGTVGYIHESRIRVNR